MYSINKCGKLKFTPLRICRRRRRRRSSAIISSFQNFHLSAHMHTFSYMYAIALRKRNEDQKRRNVTFGTHTLYICKSVLDLVVVFLQTNTSLYMQLLFSLYT